MPHKLPKEFVARGLAAAAKARETGEYYSAEEVFSELSGMLAKAEEQNLAVRHQREEDYH